jgi:hypothetical protein
MLEVQSQHLANHLNRLMDGGGSVVSCVIIPDYNKLYKLEQERMYLLSRRNIFKYVQQPAIGCFAKDSYFKDLLLEVDLAKLDHQIDLEMTKKIYSSQTAFVLLDSVSAVQRLTLAIQ